MNENGGKNNTILLTVIAIATLLVVVTGATFAYFAAVVRGNDTASSISITASETGQTLTLGGGEEVSLTNIYPKGTAAGSEWVTKNISLSSNALEGNTGTSVYAFTMSVDKNTFDFKDGETDVKDGTENIKFTFTYDADNSKATFADDTTPSGTALATAVSKQGAVIGTGTVKNNVANKVVYVLKVYYDNASYNQNNGEQREFSFHIGYTWKDSNA
ncbi:MAG: hypothetical protein J6K23_04935 [Bacilli bacterium]|nr:hypothetical protein [Bacilli bacterium]